MKPSLINRELNNSCQRSGRCARINEKGLAIIVKLDYAKICTTTVFTQQFTVRLQRTSYISDFTITKYVLFSADAAIKIKQYLHNSPKKKYVLKCIERVKNL